jgi:plastocyanin
MLDGPAIAADEPVLVVMKNHQFEPRLLHVRAGQAIRFDNSDDVLHSLLLVGHESVIGEEFVDPGQSYTVRIPQDMPPGHTSSPARSMSICAARLWSAGSR